VRLHSLLFIAGSVATAGCAPAGPSPAMVAPAGGEHRYQLVFEVGVGDTPVADNAVARMALGIERALAERGMLRAAEWEDPTLVVRFRLDDGTAAGATAGLGVRDLRDQNGWVMDRARCAGADFTPDHCSQLDWVPVMPAAMAGRAPSTVSLSITTRDADPRLVWSETRIERTSWAGIGQRRADEIARGMVRDLSLAHDS
jgi:hypothetical protein